MIRAKIPFTERGERNSPNWKGDKGKRFFFTKETERKKKGAKRGGVGIFPSMSCRGQRGERGGKVPYRKKEPLLRMPEGREGERRLFVFPFRKGRIPYPWLKGILGGGEKSKEEELLLGTQ